MRPSVGCGSGAERGKQHPALAEDRVGIKGRVWIRRPRRAPSSGVESVGGWSWRIIDRVWDLKAGPPDVSVDAGSMKVSVWWIWLVAEIVCGPGIHGGVSSATVGGCQ